MSSDDEKLWMIASIREWRNALPSFKAMGLDYVFPVNISYRRPRRKRREAPIRVERPLFFNYCAIHGDVSAVLGNEYVSRVFMRNEEVVYLWTYELRGMLIGEGLIREGRRVEVVDGVWSGNTGQIVNSRILLDRKVMGKDVWLDVEDVWVVDRPG